MQIGKHFVLPLGFLSTFSCSAAGPGANRFIKDIEMMVGNRSYIFWLWWKACWYFFSPGILVVSGASHLWFFFSAKKSPLVFLVKCRYIFKFLNTALKGLMLDSVYCLGDLVLVHHNICAPHLRNGPVSSVEPGFGLVHGCSCTCVDPHCGCLQVDTSRRKLLEGGYDACQSIRTFLLMASKAAAPFVLLTLPRFLQRLRTLCSPTEKWHPYLDVNRGEHYSVESCSRRRAEATNNK